MNLRNTFPTLTAITSLFLSFSSQSLNAQIVKLDTTIKNLELKLDFNWNDSTGTLTLRNLDSAFLLIGDEFFWEGGNTPAYNIGKCSFLEVLETFVYKLEPGKAKTYTFKLSQKLVEDYDEFTVKILTSTNKIDNSVGEEISTHVQADSINENRLKVSTNIYYKHGIRYKFTLRNDYKISLNCEPGFF